MSGDLSGARPLTAMELAVVRRAARQAEPRLEALVAVLAFTGCRIGEALQLEWGDLVSARLGQWLPHVRFKRHTVKGRDRSRHVPMVPELRDGLYRWWVEAPLANIGDRPVFAWSRSAATRALTDLVRGELGEDARLSSHSFRKSFADRLHHGGASLATIAAMLGHADVRTTTIYLSGPSPAELAAVERMIGGPP